MLAPPGQRPTYIAVDLGGLVERQPVVGPRGHGTPGSADGSRPGAASAAVRGWQATWPGGPEPVELTGQGTWIDGLRALCAAAWAAGQVTGDMVAPALKTLGDLR